MSDSENYDCKSCRDPVSVGMGLKKPKHLLCHPCASSVLDEICTPEIQDFIKAIEVEAKYQRLHWGSEHDAGKTEADWLWLIGYLAGKALHNPGGKKSKKLHRIITVGPAALNWHAAVQGRTNMRPGLSEDKTNMIGASQKD